MKTALAPIKIPKIRFFGGKVNDTFANLDLSTIGEVQIFSKEELVHIFHNDEAKAFWIY